MKVLAVAGLLTVGALAGCGDGDDDPGEQLADRVDDVLDADPDAIADRLTELGVEAAAAEVEEAELQCPAARSREPGDRATCRTEIGGATVAVVVEFGEGEQLTVIAVDLVP